MWKRDGGTATFVRQVPRESNGNDFIVLVFINGARCSALRDSGCNLVLVISFSHKTCYTGETIMVSDVFGRNRQLNMAIVEISLPVFGTDKVFKVRVAVDKTLHYYYLLLLHDAIKVTLHSKLLQRHCTEFEFDDIHTLYANLAVRR